MKKYNLLILSVLLLFACGKYEEGPNFSLRTKKARLTQEWTVSATYQNGTLVPNGTNTLTFEFNKDASFLFKATSLIDGQVQTTNRGDWEFIDKKEVLRLNFYPANSASATQVVNIEEWEILKLTINEFTVTYIDKSSGDKIRIEFLKFG
jgi:hypothetical protein